MSPARAQVQQWADLGCSLVFYATKTKGPTDRGWPTRDYKPEDYRDGQNVGVRLGTEIAPGAFLADVDFDCLEAMHVASAILPNTMGFGRASKPVSHAFYTVPEPMASYKYEDIDGTVLVEFRCRKTDGMVGLQTMVPPSIHPSGEPLECRAGSSSFAHEPTLPRRVLLVAIGTILRRHLPQQAFHHDERLAFAGFLLREGLEPDEVQRVGKALATLTDNTATDVAECVRYTEARLKHGDRVSRETRLAKSLGDKGKVVVDRIRQWLRDQRVQGGDVVVMSGGQLPGIVDRAEDALRTSDTPIYQRGGVLVRPVTIDKSTDEVRRARGATVLVGVKDAWLLEQMGRVLRWQTPSGKDADPDAKYARALLARGEWNFPVLRAVLTAPTLTRTGGIVEKPGYDPDPNTRVLLDIQPGVFPPVPVAPTKDDAVEALARLAHLLRGFPFVDDASRSVALAAMLAGLVRATCLRTVPLHAFDAPAAGTGKSMLAEMVGLLAAGVKPAALSQGKTGEEDEKRLATVLAAGDPVILIDNCERAVGGDFLCMALIRFSGRVD